MPLRGATILQVIPHLAAGGAERTTIEVAEALVAEGAKALVVSAGGRLEKELNRVGGELIRLESAPTKNPLEISANAGRIARRSINSANLGLRRGPFPRTPFCLGTT